MEYDSLLSSDSTSSLAVLAQAEAIEKKAEAYKGSAPEEEDEPVKPVIKKPAGPTLAEIKAKAKAAMILAKIKKKAAEPKKVDQTLINSGAEIVVNQEFKSGTGKRSII